MMTRIEVRSVLGAMALIAFVMPAANGGTIYHVDDDSDCVESCGTASNWSDACCGLQDALLQVGPGDEIWVAAGTYKPTVQSCDADTDCDGGTDTCSDGLCDWPLVRGKTFDLVDGVKVYGGFAGTETALTQRVLGSNETILSGDLGSDDPAGIVGCTVDAECTTSNGRLCVGGACIISTFAMKNTYNVVRADGVGSGTLLDRFTITAAYTISASSGGGINVGGGTTGLVIRDCRIANNRSDSGGGVFLHQDSEVALVRCEITQNFGRSKGGGVYAGAASGTVTSSLDVVGCKVIQNSSTDDGGGLWIGGFVSVIQNTLIAGNRSGRGGAIFALVDGGTNMTSSTVAHNKSGSNYEAVVLGAQTSTFENSVIWGNIGDKQVSMDGETTLTIDYSDVEGGEFDGIDNPDETGLDWDEDTCIGDHPEDDDPLFAAPTAMDFRGKSFSAMIDAGDKDLLPPDVFDLDGDPSTTDKIPVDVGLHTRRVDDLSVQPDAASPNEPLDMGAYEYACDSVGNPGPAHIKSLVP